MTASLRIGKIRETGMIKLVGRTAGEVLEEDAAEYAEAMRITPVLAKLMMSRGIALQDAPAFLHPAKADLLDPFLFGNMRLVMQRIRLAMEHSEKITVYADYDCDGVCGAAILALALSEAGLDADVYFPDRFCEGYGTNRDAFLKIITGGTQLIITVDCGIRSTEDVALAASFGVDVIILDHHECGEIPGTPYILNAKMPGETYPNTSICGAGVALQLAVALLGEKGLEYLDFAGVATIGDIVSLTGENRAMASLGLAKLRENPHAGFDALARTAGIDLARIQSYGVSFILVPRINAAGRMENANIAFDLLTAVDKQVSEPLAEKINTLNSRRQEIQKKIIDEATEIVRNEINLSEKRIIMVAKEGWDKGVVGLAATAVAEKFCRPTVIFAKEGGMLTGSARSIETVNLYDALATEEEKYEKFGGHAQAAGLSMREECLPGVWESVNRYLKDTYSDEEFLPRQAYDMKISAEDVDLRFAEELTLLEPFGMDNESPVFLLEKTVPKNVCYLGNGEHFKFQLQQSDAEYVWFHAKEKVLENRAYDLIGSVAVNEFRGSKRAQMVLKWMRQRGKPTYEQYIENNALSYIRHFLKEAMEACAFQRNKEKYRVIEHFEELRAAVQKSCTKSAFGTLILANSSIGAETAKRLLPIKAKFPPLPVENGELPDIPVNCVGFCAASGAFHNYSNVYLLGCFSLLDSLPNARIYAPRELIESYRQEAREYFVEQEELADYQNVIRSACGKKNGFHTISELLNAACADLDGATIKKMWFMVTVFSQLKLLEMKKGDKILIIYHEAYADLAKSECYSCIREFVEGE